MSERRRLRRHMYDVWFSNIISGGNIPLRLDEKLDQSHMSVHYNYVETGRGFLRYFIITKWPDYIETNFLDDLRSKVVQRAGVRLNYIISGEPHKIAWDSPEMVNKVNAWKRFTADAGEGLNVFDYREGKQAYEQKQRLIRSTMYLNRAELDQRRSMCKVTIILQLACDHDIESIVNCNAAAKELVAQGKIKGVKIKPINLNMVDWIKYIGLFSMRQSEGTTGKVIKKVMTDDVIANFAGYKQGRIGKDGVPMGLDIKRKEAVLYKFKDDPNKVENWIISAESGGGKSYFMKALLMWLLAEGYTVTIMDYEGDEYTPLVNDVMRESASKVRMISMGKGSSAYVDPMAIPDLTGDPEVDDDLKETAINFTLAMFRIIVHGVKGQLTRWEESVISMAISRVYDEFCVTDDKLTWCKSKNIRIKNVYECIEDMARSMELLDETTENAKHRAAVEIIEACRPYFEEGGTKSGTFKKPIRIEDVQEAKLIVFSFGAKGAAASTTDQTIMALKQLSVANLSTQISNYSKYVRHCFNVKVWEEYQRYGEIEGSAEIIGNSMTGGRKRGDINFIITNVLTNILDDTNPINKTLRQSISSYCIGKIRDVDIIHSFCEKFQLRELEGELGKISKASNNRKGNRYKHAFCIVFDDGKRAVVKAKLPKSLAESKLFSTGVTVKQDGGGAGN